MRTGKGRAGEGNRTLITILPDVLLQAGNAAEAKCLCVVAAHIEPGTKEAKAAVRQPLVPYHRQGASYIRAYR